jgi:hypothetical protein
VFVACTACTQSKRDGDPKSAEINAKCRNAEEPKSRSYKFSIILKHKNLKITKIVFCLFYRAVSVLRFTRENVLPCRQRFTVASQTPTTPNGRVKNEVDLDRVHHHQTSDRQATCRKETRKANECVPQTPTDIK